MTTARPTMGVLMVTAAAALWGLNGTVSKLLIQGGFDPPQLTTFRATGAFLGLLVFILVTRGPRTLAARGRELPRLIGYGLPGLFAVPLLYFVAISRLPVGIGLLFEFTAPVFVALWLRFGERRRVHRRLWLGLVLCVAGLVSVAELWTGRLRLDGTGVLAGLTCAVLLAVYYVLGARLVSGDAPTRDPLSLTCWGFGISAAAGAVVRPWWHFDAHLLAGQSGGVPQWLLAGYLIVFGTIVPYVLTTFAMRHLPATSVGIIGITEIAWASAFAWVLLAEALGLAQLLGGLILVAGVALAESARVTTASAGDPQDRTRPAARVVQDPRGDQPTVRAGR